ncbi:MAG: hypothetical protein JZD41_04870 [Thermoproteus sp.]|nr:hypothetical protein [Thermoproteus sp.]
MKIGAVLVLIALALPVFAGATAAPIKHVIIIIEEATPSTTCSAHTPLAIPHS